MTDDKSGFTLLELLIVMVLVALILGVTLPSITVSRHDTFPTLMDRAFQYAALTALADGEPITMHLEKRRIRVAERTWAYPDSVEAHEPAEVVVNRMGTVPPVELLFFEGKKEFTVRIGLLGTHIM